MKDLLIAIALVAAAAVLPACGGADEDCDYSYVPPGYAFCPGDPSSYTGPLAPQCAKSAPGVDSYCPEGTEACIPRQRICAVRIEGR